MRAMIWKELRGTALWALAGMLVIAAGFVVALAYTRPGPYFGRQNVTFIADLVQMVTIIGAPLVALMIGLVQSLPDSRADRWAMLVHRPVQRSTIFAAKLVAGVPLYLLAVGVPFLVAGWWASRPGSLGSPFVAPMMLPGLADILAGLVYYLAVYLVAMRHDARWIGSRTLPVFAAVLVSIGVVAVPSFAAACLCVVVGVLVMLVATWGAFVGGGEAAALPRPARPALGLCLSVGAAAVVGLAIALPMALFGGGHTPAPPRYYMTPQGQFVRITTDATNRQVLEVTDPHGQSVPEIEQAIQDQGWRDWQQHRPIAAHLWFEPRDRPLAYYHSYRSEYDRIQTIHHGVDQRVWFVHDRRVFEVYDSYTRQLIARIGRNGAAAPGQPATPFPSNMLAYPWRSWGFFFADGLHMVDFDNLDVRHLWRPPDGTSVIDGSALSYGRRPDEPWSSDFYAAVVDNEIYLLRPPELQAVANDDEPDIEPVATLPEPFDAQRWNWSEVFLLRDPDRLVIWQRGRDPTAGPEPVAYFSLADAQRIAEAELPLIEAEWTTHPGEYVAFALAPPGVAVPAIVLDHIRGRASTLPGAAALSLLLAGAALWAAMGWLIPHRYARPRRVAITWAILAGLLGPAALLAMWAMRDWPASQPCPSCGRRRVVDRDTCEHCNAAWPAPVRDGTEIFDEARMQPA